MPAIETAAVIELTTPIEKRHPCARPSTRCGKRVILLRDGRPILGLVHVGEGEFRLAGWTDERTLHITP